MSRGLGEKILEYKRGAEHTINKAGGSGFGSSHQVGRHYLDSTMMVMLVFRSLFFLL